MNPILRDIPEQFETGRLLIRVPRPGDGPAVNAAVLETFDTLHPWMPWAKERPSVEQSEEWTRSAYSRFIAKKDMVLLLFHKETGLFLGGSGLHPLDWDVPKFEIGYWCRTRFERQGYITEAVKGILRFGFEVVGAKRIEIHCHARNQRSARVAERVGIRREGELRNDSVGLEGALRDTLVFAMTDADWKNQTVSHDADEQAIRDLVSTWLSATKSGDLAAVLALMSDDVIFMTPGQEPFGKEAFAAASKGMKGMQFDAASDIAEIKVLGDWAWLRNHLRITITPPGGKPIVRSGYTLTILRKTSNGKWMVTRDANLVVAEAKT